MAIIIISIHLMGQCAGFVNKMMVIRFIMEMTENKICERKR